MQALSRKDGGGSVAASSYRHTIRFVDMQKRVTSA